MFSFQPLLLCWNCFCWYFYLEGTLLLIQMWKKCCSVFIEVHVWDGGLSSVYCSSISSVISISSLFLDHVACLSWTETSFCTHWLFLFLFFTAKPNVKLWLNCCPAATTSLFMEELKEFLFQICDVLAGYVNNVNVCVCRSQQMATDWWLLPIYQLITELSQTHCQLDPIQSQTDGRLSCCCRFLQQSSSDSLLSSEMCHLMFTHRR